MCGKAKSTVRTNKYYMDTQCPKIHICWKHQHKPLKDDHSSVDTSIYTLGTGRATSGYVFAIIWRSLCQRGKKRVSWRSINSLTSKSWGERMARTSGSSPKPTKLRNRKVNIMVSDDVIEQTYIVETPA